MLQYRYADNICHHGVKGMKWGVRRAIKKSSRRAKLHSKQAQSYKSIVDDINRGSYKKHGYKNQKQANADIKNWKRLISDEQKIAKKWTETHDELLSRPMKSSEANRLAKSGMKYTRDVLLKGDNYVMNHPVTDEDA